MSQTIEVIVPDIGNFKDVPIIELCVKAGDTVKAEDALLTLESDKATIDIPSPADGVIKELKVSIGDKVSEGSIVAIIEAAEKATVRPVEDIHTGNGPPFGRELPGRLRAQQIIAAIQAGRAEELEFQRAADFLHHLESHTALFTIDAHPRVVIVEPAREILHVQSR